MMRQDAAEDEVWIPGMIMVGPQDETRQSKFYTIVTYNAEKVSHVHQLIHSKQAEPLLPHLVGRRRRREGGGGGGEGGVSWRGDEVWIPGMIMVGPQDETRPSKFYTIVTYNAEKVSPYDQSNNPLLTLSVGGGERERE